MSTHEERRRAREVGMKLWSIRPQVTGGKPRVPQVEGRTFLGYKRGARR